MHTERRHKLMCMFKSLGIFQITLKVWHKNTDVFKENVSLEDTFDVFPCVLSKCCFRRSLQTLTTAVSLFLLSVGELYYQRGPAH